jgi:hypothetical protein
MRACWSGEVSVLRRRGEDSSRRPRLLGMFPRGTMGGLGKCVLQHAREMGCLHASSSSYHSVVSSIVSIIVACVSGVSGVSLGGSQGDCAPVAEPCSDQRHNRTFCQFLMFGQAGMLGCVVETGLGGLKPSVLSRSEVVRQFLLAGVVLKRGYFRRCRNPGPCQGIPSAQVVSSRRPRGRGPQVSASRNREIISYQESRARPFTSGLQCKCLRRALLGFDI